MSIFKVPTKRISSPMPGHKVSTFLSEISTFFKKNNAEGAMFTIMNVIKGVKMNEQTLFGRKSWCNSVYPLLYVFQFLFSGQKPMIYYYVYYQ